MNPVIGVALLAVRIGDPVLRVVDGDDRRLRRVEPIDHPSDAQTSPRGLPVALRELAEETGFGAADIEAFYDLDLVNQFHEPSVDGIVTAAVFAVRLHPDAEPRLSHEHDAAEWHALEQAHDEVIWPGYRTAIERIRDDLSDPDRAKWFELSLAGDRAEAATRPTGVAGW